MGRKPTARGTKFLKSNRPRKRNVKPDLDAKFFARRVPLKRKIEIIIPERIIKRMGFDPSKPAAAQRTEAQQKLSRHIGGRFGNTQKIVDSVRGLTIDQILDIANSEAEIIKKLTSDVVLAKRDALSKEGGPGWKAAADKYLEISTDYAIHGHRQVVCQAIASNFFMDMFFPQWEPELKKRVQYTMPEGIIFLDSRHYQTQGGKIMRQARGNVTKLYKQLVGHAPPKSIRNKITRLSLTKAEKVAGKLTALVGEVPVKKSDWPKIQKIILK